MKNKKVIIITRDSNKTYSENSEAFKNYKAYIANSGKQKIHHYIKKYIKSVFFRQKKMGKDYALKCWDPLTRTGILPSYYEMYGGDDGKDSKYEELYANTDKTQKFEGWLECEITKKIENINPKDTHVGGEVDNKPYVSFTYKNDNKEKYDVCFVFLNRIFDTFVNGSEQYGALVNDESRLDFIKAICEDCGLEPIAEDNQSLKERAILYIHDKEWYVSGAPYTAMLKGKYTKMAKSPIEQQKELQKYFDTIKVFLHIPSPFFDEIKKMNFTEKDEDLEILERKFY